MRKQFADTLLCEAKKNTSILLLTGDLGFSVFEGFMHEFPNRFFNMGVAEVNMVGVAAGLALSGKKPFVYSIVPFVTMRCYEQVRNDVCYQNADVKIVGVGGGFSYGVNGPTHHAISDIAIMRALPNIVVVCPADPVEASLATIAAVKNRGPVYLRLGRNEEPVVHLKEPVFELGKAIELRKGNDASLISTGNMLNNCVIAAEKLCGKGIECRVVSMHTVKPLDKNTVLKAAKETKAVFSVEEHSLVGGLGSAVSEVLAESGNPVLFKRIALPDKFACKIGSQKYLQKINMLSAESIAETVLKTVESGH
ncbi:MAG: hypothetical protein JW744_04770 [Candidatus Diapherotrites archaeon]|uniref:Transketolase-like pyrimidine-binding domain-containing protein n=1 Tax=Candidatus Iainarchaeum sp. TaxID=3101447 RepID=A0A938YXQ7_9ARCH|nr:hypothetical protein [Candidatus Diapherotrites archaeon]